VTSGSNATNWTADLILPGSLFTIPGHSSGQLYVISSVDAAAQTITLEDNWVPPDVSLPAAYIITISPTSSVTLATDASGLGQSGTTSDQVIAQGFASPADGGGGTLVYDSGTITPSGEPLGIQFPAVIGRFIRPTDGILHSKWFGVKHDGTGDQTNAMQAFIREVVQTKSPNGTYPGSYLGDDGYLGFIDPGRIECGGGTLYISDNTDQGLFAGTIDGGAVGHRAFRGAGKFATRILNAAISVGDLPGSLVGGPKASTVSLSSFSLEGYLDLWSPQTATIFDRLGIKNPATSFHRAYTSGTDTLDQSLCNIYDALQIVLLGVFFEASQNGSTPATNGIRINRCNNLTWIGGGFSSIVGAPDAGLIGLAVDTLGLAYGDTPSAIHLLLQDLHFEGLKQESVYLKSVINGTVSCHFRTYATHDCSHAVVQVGNANDDPRDTCDNISVRSCYAVSDGNADTFLQVSQASGVLIGDNNLNGFAIGTTVGSGAKAVIIEPSTILNSIALPGSSQDLAMLTVSGVVNSGNISGAVFSTGTGATGTFAAGQPVFGPGVVPGTFITSGSGTSWNVNIAQRVSATKFVTAATSAVSTGSSIASTILTAGTVTSGGFASGQTLYGVGVIPGTVITGGAGSSFTVNHAQTVSSTAISGVSPAAVANGFVSGNLLDVSSVSSGTLAVGGLVTAGVGNVGGVSGDSLVTSTGTTMGGAGIYSVAASVPSSSRTMAALPPAAVVMASISNDTLTVSEVVSGTLAIGQTLLGCGVAPGTTITAGSGSSFTVSAPSAFPQFNGPTVITAFATAATFTASTTGTTLSVGTVSAGSISIGDAITGPGVETGTVITGGSGSSYTINVTQSASSTTMRAIASAAVFTGTISSGVITITTLTSGSVAWGQYLVGPAIPPGTWVTTTGTGTLGSGGTVSLAQTLPPLAYAVMPPATFIGTISGTALSVSSLTGTIAVGQTLQGTGVAVGTTVTSTSPTYVVSISQTIGPTSMTTFPVPASIMGSISLTTLNVDTLLSGALAVGQNLTGLGVATNTTISGVSAGVYSVSPSQTTAPTAMTATSGPIGAVVTGSVSDGVLNVLAVNSGTVSLGSNLEGPGLAPGTKVEASVSAPTGVTAYSLEVDSVSFSISSQSYRAYSDPIADATVDLGLQTSAVIKLSFASSLDFALTLNQTGHTLEVASANNVQTSAEYNLVITNSSSSNSISHWGTSGIPIVFSGAAPDFSGMTGTQYARVRMKAMDVAGALTLFCDAAIFG
jgi:hypothetical protein